MEQKPHSQKILRRRKSLLVLPLIVLPFVTLLFWVFGGGKSSDVNAQQEQKGLNMQLPGANFKDDTPLDKLSYYNNAALDSLKLQQLMENDPYYHGQEDTDTTTIIQDIDTSSIDIQYRSGVGSKRSTMINQSSPFADPNETKVYRKLAQLDAALNKASTPEETPEDDLNSVQPTLYAPVNSADVDRLEQMMQVMNQKDEDPEMQQLNGTLEKILDIQHPDRVREKIKQTSEAKKGQVFTVSSATYDDPVSMLDNGSNRMTNNSTGQQVKQSNGFYSLDDEPSAFENILNAIEAVVHETQTVVNGSTVKLRLANDIYINGVHIPKNTFVFGTASLNGERLNIEINNIRYQNALFPVELSVFDMDGINGIYIPGAISRDVAKQSANAAIQNIGITSLDASAGVQAASAGIEAAKSLLSKKVKLIKVTLKAGYQVLLRDEKQNQSN